MAKTVQSASNGIKSAYTTATNAIKPIALSTTFLSAVAVFDGGLSAATLAALNSGSAAGILTIPVEGFKETAEGLSAGAQWIADAVTPA